MDRPRPDRAEPDHAEGGLRGEPDRRDRDEPGLHRLEIPQTLHSVYEEAPFSRCSICDHSLYEADGKRQTFSSEPGADGRATVLKSAPDGCSSAWNGLAAAPEGRNTSKSHPSKESESPSISLNGTSFSLEGVYEIQKVFRGSEVIFETALCHGCGEALAKELSEASLAAMQGYLLCRFRPSRETCHCHFCGMPRTLFRNFSLVGVCRERSLLLPEIVMCESCSETLNERISKKTRDIQGEFLRDNFPGVPADLDLSPSLPGLL